jgi:hypothetical protein
MMNLVYHSDHYYVVEYPAQHGYELVDKTRHRSAFVVGDAADRFRVSIEHVWRENPSSEHIDAFLDELVPLLNMPVVMH